MGEIPCRYQHVAARDARTAGQEPSALASHQGVLRLAHRIIRRRGVRAHVLYLDHAADLRHGRRRPADRVRARARARGLARVGIEQACLCQLGLARADVRARSRRLQLRDPLRRSCPLRSLRLRSNQTPVTAALPWSGHDSASRADGAGVLSIHPCLSGWQDRRRGVDGALRHRYREYRRPDKGGGCSHVGGRHEHSIRLHAFVLLRRPGQRRRRGALPACADAGQAHRRAVYGAGPHSAGQDRALSGSRATPEANPGCFLPRTRRQGHGDGGVHTAIPSSGF